MRIGYWLSVLALAALIAVPFNAARPELQGWLVAGSLLCLMAGLALHCCNK